MEPKSTFKNQVAPCGQTESGKTYEDRDEETLLTEECYACGCVVIRHEYHDGSVNRKVIHHNGKVLVDELIAAE